MILLFRILHHHTKFVKKNVLWFKRHDPDRHSLTFWTFTVTLTLNVVIILFYRTLQLMMLCNQTKFGCKEISSLEDIVEIVIFWLCKPCDLDLEDSEPNFLYDTSHHDNKAPYQVWLKMAERFRRYRQDKIWHSERITDKVILFYPLPRPPSSVVNSAYCICVCGCMIRMVLLDKIWHHTIIMNYFCKKSFSLNNSTES